MKILQNKEGVALIATLILGMIAISFTLTMVYLSREGTRLSGIEGRYQMALQAAKGGVDIAVDYLRNCAPDPLHKKPSFYSSVGSLLNCSCSMGSSSNKTYYPCDGASSAFNASIGDYHVSVAIHVETLVSPCENVVPPDPNRKSAVCFCKITSNSTNANPNKHERASMDVLYKLVVENCNN